MQLRSVTAIGRLWFALTFIAPIAVACGPPGYDIVVRECIEDGNRLKYCECVAKAMRESLKADDYGIFTEFTMLGGIEAASPEDILIIMENHELSPADLAELRGRVDTLSQQVHRQCAA